MNVLTLVFSGDAIATTALFDHFEKEFIAGEECMFFYLNVLFFC